MTLLSLERVTRRGPHNPPSRPVLSDVTLHVDTGEFVAVWGMRRSGRSTLLRVAAGIEPPDAGIVRFAGAELHGDGELGSGIGWCRLGSNGPEAQAIVDELMVGQLARGVSHHTARATALAALERVDATHCAAYAPHELDGADSVRVAIARALVPSPSLLVVDEPAKGIDLLERQAILSLLRSLADDGVAVLTSAGEAAELAGADRALSLSHGELRGSVAPELAPVVQLRRHASA